MEVVAGSGEVVDLLGIQLELALSVGDLIVGAGTLALALFTWSLARQTKAEVGQSEKEQELTREGLALSFESIEAADRPFVVATRGEDKSEPLQLRRIGEEPGVLLFDVWNLGKGPAVVTSVELTVDGKEWLLPLEREIPVEQGGTRKAVVQVHLGALPDDFPGPSFDGDLRVFYSHASGSKYVTECIVEIVAASVHCKGFSRSKVDALAPTTEESR